uniref:Reverse transcriptase Ty1/copia-type domain-containing protein n=1 Tax=Fagus sylvatica TaxID=28930 RepID=A0A2N9G970_FAGSY
MVPTVLVARGGTLTVGINSDLGPLANLLIKTKSDGTIERYKARLVAKGYAQEYGIDYKETFAHVARITSVHSLLAIAAVHQWPLFQMDVKIAFLNGDLTEEVYMQAPPAILCISLASPPVSMIQHCLSADLIKFEMKDDGHLGYFLGLEVSSDSTGYYLSQAKYASDLLSRAGLTDTKVVSTPLEMKLALLPWMAHLSVMPLSISILGYSHSTHYAAVLHILRYIKGTMFHGLHFSAHSTLDLCAYSDFDWAGDPTDHHFTIGFCFFLGDSLISWHISSSDQTANIFTKTFPPSRFRDLVSKLKMASVRPP